VAAAGLIAACGGCGVFGIGQSVSYLGYSGTAIVSADGRTLIVGPYGNECGATVTAVAKENATKVALFVQSTTGSAPACQPGAGAMSLVVEQSIRLQDPLGRRKLVDGASGRPTPWLSGRLVLRPTVLPRGYRLMELRPWVTQSIREAACDQVYQARGNANVLEIIQVAGRSPNLGPGPDGWTRIRVRGHPGRASENLITWREDGLIDYVTAYRLGGTQRLPTTKQLIAIADSASTG
jgi:hypothetical protein